MELFLRVCDGVQHARQKGVIHRDLKPSNILVAEQDQRSIPKIIDFGVAKATGATLADASVYTELGSIVGTLEYMSPAIGISCWLRNANETTAILRRATHRAAESLTRTGQ